MHQSEAETEDAVVEGVNIKRTVQTYICTCMAALVKGAVEEQMNSHVVNIQKFTNAANDALTKVQTLEVKYIFKYIYSIHSFWNSKFFASSQY